MTDLYVAQAFGTNSLKVCATVHISKKQWVHFKTFPSPIWRGVYGTILKCTKNNYLVYVH